jgi:hypothetical protein
MLEKIMNIVCKDKEAQQPIYRNMSGLQDPASIPG